MKAFERVSPSQINNFVSCQRLWWWQSIFGLKPPQRASAELGEAVHGQLEKYLLEGVRPDESTKEGQIALPGLELLPAPGTVLVELDLTEQQVASNFALTLADIPVSGRLDGMSIVEPKPLIFDHKTSSDLKWAKTAEELQDDPQMVIYAQFARHWLAANNIFVNEISVAHIVYLTKGKPRAKRTETTLTADHLDQQWVVLDGIVEKMKVAGAETNPAKVEPNLAACGKYGGCHFRDKCRLLGTFGAVLDDPLRHLFDSAAPAGNNTVLPDGNPLGLPAPDVAAAQPQAKESGMAEMSLIEKLRAQRAAKEGANGATNGAGAATPTPEPQKPSEPIAPPPVENKPAPTSPVDQTQTSAPPTGGSSPSAADLMARMRAARDKAPTDGARGVVPPDAPPQSDPNMLASLANGSAADTSTDTGGKGARRPPRYKQKLKELDWTEDQATLMSPAACAYIIEKAIKAAAGRIDENGDFVAVDGSRPVVTAPSESAPNPVVQTPAPDTQGASANAAEGAAVVSTVVAPAAATTQTRASIPHQQISATPVGELQILIPHQTDEQRKKGGGWTAPEGWERNNNPAPAVAPAPWQQGLVIYIDAIPEKGHHARNFVTLEDVLVPFIFAAESQLSAASYGLVPYNEGSKAVAALVAGNISGIAGRWPTIVASSRFPASQACLEMLLPHAVMVVRGR